MVTYKGCFVALIWQKLNKVFSILEIKKFLKAKDIGQCQDPGFHLQYWENDPPGSQDGSLPNAIRAAGLYLKQCWEGPLCS